MNHHSYFLFHEYICGKDKNNNIPNRVFTIMCAQHLINILIFPMIIITILCLEHLNFSLCRA